MRALTDTGNALEPDLEECEYVLWMGTFPGSNGKSMQSIAKQVAERLAQGKCKMDVIDPVLGNGNVTPTMEGINWIPIKPATNGAFCSAVVRWMIENDAYAADLLAAPNYAAGMAAGFASFTNASHLVIVDDANPNNRKLMRAADAGLETPPADPEAKTQPTYYVVIDEATGQPALHTASDRALLDWEGEVNGVKVRTGFSLLRESVFERDMDEYAEITGVSRGEIERIAREFTSHGVKSSTRAAGSTCAQTGFDASMGFRTLNTMIGCNQMIGGNVPFGLAPTSTGDGPRYKLGAVKGKPDVSTKNATYISRTARPWQKTDEYAVRVAAGEKDPQPKLPWYPAGVASDNQALFSVVNQYPYQAKIMMTWMNNVIQNTPNGLRAAVTERLADPAVVPLHIACDVVVGELAQYADYIVPDTNPFESFGVVAPQGHWHGKGAGVRWQAKVPGTMELPDGRYASFEAFICDVGRACGVPGFGDDAIAGADGSSWALDDAADYFLKAVANLAYAEPVIDDISDEEARIQGLDDLPASWKAAVTAEEWPKVLKVLSRGGRFYPVSTRVGKDGRSGYAKEYQSFVYSELRATNKNPYSGTFARGTLGYTPESFANWSPMSEWYSPEEYPFAAANYKPRFRTVTMEANSPIMRDLCAENYLEISLEDAAALGIRDGDRIRATTPAGDVMEAPAMVRAGVAAGTIGIAHGYGHEAYGAQDVDIDGAMTKGNPAIGSGFNIQQVVDPVVAKDGVLYGAADNDGSTPLRNGGMFKIEKA